ncbi:MAG TPA: YdeI/OmpD-associated family protein [Gemmatimonadaceae bacterium]|nr:YdeI/OmpD-associated family protein [Gemmatimonadaceae bacterium]
MGTRDPRIDAYIAKQKDFARPILVHLRDIVHAACPDVEETLKWSSPHFMYKGGMMCGMAAFKEHAIFGFWKGSLIEGVSPNRNNGGTAMGNFGCLTSVKDLPGRKQLTALIKEAMRLNDEGIVVARPKRAAKPEAVVPPELAAALKRNKPAAAQFDGFSPSNRREYIEWVDDAKREETKAKRVAQAVEWIAEGKARNWKYQR